MPISELNKERVYDDNVKLRAEVACLYIFATSNDSGISGSDDDNCMRFSYFKTLGSDRKRRYGRIIGTLDGKLSDVRRRRLLACGFARLLSPGGTEATIPGPHLCGSGHHGRGAPGERVPVLLAAARGGIMAPRYQPLPPSG